MHICLSQLYFKEEKWEEEEEEREMCGGAMMSAFVALANGRDLSWRNLRQTQHVSDEHRAHSGFYSICISTYLHV